MGKNFKEPFTIENALEKILRKRSINENGCWLWMGSLNRGGYGTLRLKFSDIQVKTIDVHRLYFCLLNNLSLETKSHILHRDNLCRNRHCFNPAHLYEGTRKQNRRDAMRFGSAYIHKTKDSQGKFTSKAE